MALLEYVYMFKEYELGFGFQILIESISEIFWQDIFQYQYLQHAFPQQTTNQREM